MSASHSSVPLNPELARRRRQLLNRLRELDRRLHGIEDEILAHHDRDWDDQATLQEQDDALIALGEEGRREVLAIRAALRRIAEGTYGECVRCGEPIEPARLDLLPWTPLCASCARGEG